MYVIVCIVFDQIRTLIVACCSVDCIVLRETGREDVDFGRYFRIFVVKLSRMPGRRHIQEKRVSLQLQTQSYEDPGLHTLVEDN